MNTNQLYDIETEIYRKIDCIKAEHKQYAAGVEKGIDMTVNAVRKALNSEESKSDTSDCSYCNFETDVGADFPEPDEFKIIRNKGENGKYGYSLATDGNNVFRICKIRYCPMCGRLLKSEEAE